MDVTDRVERMTLSKAASVLLGVLLLMNPGTGWTETASLQPGITQLEGTKHPVFLLIPRAFRQGRLYPLVISLPGDEESAAGHIESWKSLADQRSIVVAVPEIWLREGWTPYPFDEWLIALKDEILNLFPVAPQKVFLVGNSSNAHYAAYLGMNYPEEFSGVAMHGGGWSGPLEKIMKYQKKPEKQIPFFVAFREEDAVDGRQIEDKALELQQRGYPVHVESVGQMDDFVSSDFRKKTYEWLSEKGEAWRESLQDREPSWREKFWSTIVDNVKIDK